MLGGGQIRLDGKPYDVLILVFREDMLGEVKKLMMLESTISLNPCFSGRYAGSSKIKKTGNEELCLNPCFSGRYAGRRRARGV